MILDFIFSLFLLQPVAAPEISVHFCPFENCTQLFIEYISTAHSIDCAFYELGEEVSAAFPNVSSYRLVIDGDYKKNYQPKNTRYENKSSLMHNKFCIINKTVVLTGSTNPTKSGLEVNHNEFILIKSRNVVLAYQAEFEELWSGVYSRGERNTYWESSQNCFIRPYFCPEDSCEDVLLSQIRKARESIEVYSFVLSSKAVLNQLILASERNISVTVFVDTRQAFRAVPTLVRHAISVYIPKHKGMFHYKLFRIDDIIITGSYNPTQNANTKNDENMLIIGCGISHKYDWLRSYYETQSERQNT